MYLTEALPAVNFTTTDPTWLPPPDPRYLTLHAACARVAHFSGVGNYLCAVISEAKEVMGDDPDGLHYALIAVMSRGVSEISSEQSV